MQVESKLTAAEKILVAGSRAAILRTGISEPYFDRHFKLLRVVNQPGDRRVLWKYSINQYGTIVSDVIGYYTQAGKRIDTHGVATTLFVTTDIKQTIPRWRANRIMRACIGDFTNASVEYRGSGQEKAKLVLVAEFIPKAGRSRDKDSGGREARERTLKAQSGKGVDIIEAEEENTRPPIFFGSVDLETGKCVKGRAAIAP